MIQGVEINPLQTIAVSGGDVRHYIKESNLNFKVFGEAYFSEILYDHIKAWKLHRKAHQNFTVPFGKVEFVLIDAREESKTFGNVMKVLLDDDKNYRLLTVPPKIWYGFRGLASGKSLIANISSIEHDPNESDNLDINHFDDLHSWF